MAEVEGGKGKAHTHRHHRQQAEVDEVEVVLTCIMTAAEGMLIEAEEVAGGEESLAEAVGISVGVAGTEGEAHQGAAGISPALSHDMFS